jgi:hypothetical protein
MKEKPRPIAANVATDAKFGADESKRCRYSAARTKFGLPVGTSPQSRRRIVANRKHASEVGINGGVQ